MPRLNMKICVITGAARGIGRAIAERFHNEGAIVILTDIDVTAGAGRGDARVGRGDVYHGDRDQHRRRSAGRVSRVAGVIDLS